MSMHLSQLSKRAVFKPPVCIAQALYKAMEPLQLARSKIQVTAL